MRIAFKLSHRTGAVLPMDYRAAVSAWIYKTIAQNNPELSQQLHDEGFTSLGHRKFKYFTFGNISPKRFEAKGSTFTLAEGPSRLEASFYLSEIAQNLMMGMFKDMRFHLGSYKRPELFEITQAVVLPSPEWSGTMRFRLISPCCIAKTEAGARTATYLPPSHAEFGERLIQNLKNKYMALPDSIRPSVDLAAPCHFKLIREGKPRLHRIHNTKVRGYLFDFELTAPVELIKLGYYAGFGEKGAGLGFGFGQIC